MSKPKTMIKQNKAKKSKEQVPTTPDDFLALGVSHEESAGKWRAGDASKSLRFFTRAIETYNEGLAKFPGSLDLAYNKARVQLEVVTNGPLVRQLRLDGVGVIEGLREAEGSHRYVLALPGGQGDADSLFNMATVLTALAEEMAKEGDEAARADVLKLLEEALELQGKCLSVQEMRFEESEGERQAMLEDANDDFSSSPGGVVLPDDESVSGTSAKEDQWFSVLEPITTDILIETAMAQLGTLTTLCSILASSSSPPSSPSLAWIEEFSSALISSKISSYTASASPSRLREIALTKANFLSSFLEASFHQSTISAETYKTERDTAFKHPDLQVDSFPEALIANSESLISFSSALADVPSPPEDYHAATRWQALSTAIANLATASKLPSIDAESKVKTHLLRGEASLLQWRLGHDPAKFDSAVKHGVQLLKNAEVFFRNAGKLTSDEEEKTVAEFRSAMVKFRQSWQSESSSSGDADEVGEEEAGGLVMQLMQQKGKDWVKDQIEDMVEEGLMPDDVWKLFV